MTERRPLDQYNTPVALARTLASLLPITPEQHVMEPHTGAGSFAEALVSLRGNKRLYLNDIDPDQGGLLHVPERQRINRDFLSIRSDVKLDWIIGNPPYRDAIKHAQHAFGLARNVAFLMRLQWAGSWKRLDMWREHPPRKVWVVVPRPSFTGGGSDRAQEYAWFWWDETYKGEPTIDWVTWKARRGA